MSQDVYNEGWESGFSSGEMYGYTKGFSAGFWSAVLLIGGMVLAGLIIMRIAEGM
jgi:tetrahydromethanopterin S-methyltransferase subunit F